MPKRTCPPHRWHLTRFGEYAAVIAGTLAAAGLVSVFFTMLAAHQ